MRSTFKIAIMAGAAWGALGSVALAQPAPQATTAQQNSGNTVTEITVTARRRDELLKNVPIADTVYGAEKLDQSGASTIADLQKTTPNLTLQVARGSNSTLTAFIRGIGQQDPLWGFEPGVGLYIDDVYIARPQASVLDVFDVQRVEILRGPQGTLYGRNTIGGAIKYVTAPIGNTPEVDARVTLGSYGEHDEILSAKAPLFSNLYGSFAVAKYDHNGWGHDLYNGAQTDNKNVTAGRATLEWRPNDDLWVRLSGDITRDDSLSNNGHRETPYTDVHTGVTYNVLPGVYDTQAGADPQNHVRAEGLSLTGSWTFAPAWTAKSITAYRDGVTRGVIDFDALPKSYLDIPAYYRDHQFTQEFQLLYSGERLHGVGGLFYMNASAAGAFDTDLSNFVYPLGVSILTDGYVNTSSYAAFADVSYDVTDQLQISVGGRYTQDKKTGHVYRETYLKYPSPYFGGPGIPFKNNTNYTNSATYDKFTPRLSATYKVTPEVTAYASWGSGFKSGGFDMRGDATLYPATVNGYQPETVSSTELGLKGSVFDHRLSFATDIFNADYKNQQITTQYPATAGIASVVENAAASRIRGWEAEGSGRITDAFTVNFTLGYTDAKYNKYISYIPLGTPGATCTGYCDVSGQRFFAYTPKWDGSITPIYTWDLGEHGRLRASATAAYRGPYEIYDIPHPEIDQTKGYWLYDANLVWTSASNRWEVGLHGKNLSDEKYKAAGYFFNNSAPSGVNYNNYANTTNAFYGPPRTILLTVSAKFY